MANEDDSGGGAGLSIPHTTKGFKVDSDALKSVAKLVEDLYDDLTGNTGYPETSSGTRRRVRVTSSVTPTVGSARSTGQPTTSSRRHMRTCMTACRRPTRRCSNS